MRSAFRRSLTTTVQDEPFKPPHIRMTPIDGLLVLERTQHKDDRGSLDRLFDLEAAGDYLHEPVVAQVNHSVTSQSGTVRGMHFQRPPHLEFKIITCLKGRVFDVAVDVRMGSPTFLQWHGEVLAHGDGRSLALTPGLAHGFQALDDDCELIYVHGGPYRPEAEAGLRPDDPAVGIIWPEPVVMVSDRDSMHPLVGENWSGVDL